MLNRWYFRRESVLQDFRYLKRSAFLYLLTRRGSKHLVYLDDSMQLLQNEIPCPIAVDWNDQDALANWLRRDAVFQRIRDHADFQSFLARYR